MSNLGFYKDITKLIKGVGGPAMFKGLAAAAGGALFIAGAAARPAVEKGLKAVGARFKNRAKPCEFEGRVFEVHSDGDDGTGVVLAAGTAFRVLECDGDSILIEVIDGEGNPHFASAAFLSSVSDFPEPLK